MKVSAFCVLIVKEDQGDGARYRVRTCDPHHVKVMLYH